MESTPRRLCWHGMLLFLLGLATGLAVQQLANPRMGLAAHLEGLMNGTFLLALGAVWSHVRLSPRAEKAAFIGALYGTYANWVTTTLAAALGTAAMTPLASGVHQGRLWQEILVTFGLGSVALAMLVSSTLLLWGLRHAAQGLPRQDTSNGQPSATGQTVRRMTAPHLTPHAADSLRSPLTPDVRLPRKESSS